MLTENSQPPTLQEQQDVLDRLYPGLTSLVLQWAPGLNYAQVNGYLRSVDFNHFDPAEREIFRNLLPALTASVLPPEDEQPSSPVATFYEQLNNTEIEADGLILLQSDREPVLESYLQSQTAVLRSTTLFAQHALGLDCKAILKGKLPYLLAEMIIKTRNRVPADLLRRLTVADRQLLLAGATMETEATEGLRQTEIDWMIESTLDQLNVPVLLGTEQLVATQRIRNDLSQAVWKACQKLEKVIKTENLERFFAIKRLLKRSPDFSVLISWLIGEKN